MKTVVAAAIGECVHVAGVINFLRLAETVGWRTVFMGPATPIEEIIATAKEEKADLVGISYRLTPENGEHLIASFAEQADALKSAGVQFAFGGPPPMAEKARKLGFFDINFDGTEPTEQVISFLKGQEPGTRKEIDYPQHAIDRIRWKSPMPLIRHHFGLPDMDATLKGIEKIAQSRMVDVISLGIDQDAQENFFHPEKQDAPRHGAGGVPVRSAKIIELVCRQPTAETTPCCAPTPAPMISSVWQRCTSIRSRSPGAAVPLYWFNQMDGRGPWDLEGSIREHQKLMACYGERNIPVEAQRSRTIGACATLHDVVFVVSAYLSAYNASAFGVKDHIVQMMFNSPPRYFSRHGHRQDAGGSWH